MNDLLPRLSSNRLVVLLPSRLIPILLTVYLLLILLGAGALARPEIAGRAVALTLDRAFFLSVNAATLCGFPSTVRLGDLSTAGQAVVFGLTLGGTFITLLVGGWALKRIIQSPISDSAVAALSAVLVALSLLAGWGFFAEESSAAGMMLGLSALGNCGLVLGAAPTAVDWRLHAVLLPLAVAGGLGIPVLVELFHSLRGGSISRHSWTVLLMSAGAYLFFLAAFWLLQGLAGERSMPLRGQFAAASAAALNSRSAGFGLQAVYALPRAMQWMLMLSMLIGGAPGGTAGGLKLTTASELARAWARLRKGDAVNASLYWALSWLGIYLALMGAALLVLLQLQPQTPADRMLFDVISSLSLAGLSFNPASQTGAALYMLCALMLAGRFIPFLLLWSQARAPHAPEVAVG